MIEVISNNTTVLINEYGSENIGKLKQLNKIRGNSSPFIPYDGNGKNELNKKKYNKVARLILIKDFIAEFVWYILNRILSYQHYNKLYFRTKLYLIFLMLNKKFQHNKQLLII